MYATDSMLSKGQLKMLAYGFPFQCPWVLIGVGGCAICIDFSPQQRHMGGGADEATRALAQESRRAGLS